MIFQPVDPFPDPTHAGQEIENIGLMFGTILILLVLILLMIYFYKKRKDFFSIIIIYLFSIILGLDSFIYGIPFTPYFQIFFIFLQSSFFLLSSLEFYNNYIK